MRPEEQIELARAYVALSNAHVLRLIEPMLSMDAVYTSANVGEFVGRADICAMMEGFFSRFPDVHWRTSKFRNTTANTVQFNFVMTGTDASTGAPMERTSREAVTVSATGEITRVEVF